MYNVYIDGSDDPIYHDIQSNDQLNGMLTSVKEFATTNPAMDRNVKVMDGDDVVYNGPVSNWSNVG